MEVEERVQEELRGVGMVAATYMSDRSASVYHERRRRRRTPTKRAITKGCIQLVNQEQEHQAFKEVLCNVRH